MRRLQAAVGVQVATVADFDGVFVIDVVQRNHSGAAPWNELAAVHLVRQLAVCGGGRQVAVALPVGVVQVHLWMYGELYVPPLSALTLAVYVVLLSAHVRTERRATERPLSLLIVLEQETLRFSCLLAVACQVSILVCGQISLLARFDVYLVGVGAVLEHPNLIIQAQSTTLAPASRGKWVEN